MQHVGVGDDDVAGGPDRAAGGGRRIAVVGKGLDVGVKRMDELLELVHLIGGQRLRGKQVQRAGVRLREDPVEHRQVVAQRFAAGGRRHHDEVLARMRGPKRLGLVRVQGFDPALAQGARQTWVDGVREGCRPCGSCGERLPGGDARREVWVRLKAVEDL